jgi:hypothetical protein
MLAPLMSPRPPSAALPSVAAALQTGGGRVAEGGGLCRGVTHVVCPPEAALRWLALGKATPPRLRGLDKGFLFCSAGLGW